MDAGVPQLADFIDAENIIRHGICYFVSSSRLFIKRLSELFSESALGAEKSSLAQPTPVFL